MAQSIAADSDEPPPASPMAKSLEVCQANFAVRGGRLTGFTLSTFEEFPGVSPSQAFERLARAMADDKGTLQNANEKLGTLSALGALGPNVDAGHPSNGTIRPVAGGARVELSWFVGPFITFHKGDVEDHFCKWLEHVSHDRS
jgi:hypothetical protein